MVEGESRCFNFVIEPKKARRTIINCQSSGLYRVVQRANDYIQFKEGSDSPFVRVSSEFL